MGVMVVLLRGINVGGRNRLPMADLRAICDGAGFGEVETYIQSGNVVLDAGRKGPNRVERELRTAILASTGLDVATVARTADEWAAIVAANPYPDAAAADPKKVHLTCRHDAAPDGPEGLADLDLDLGRFAPEHATVAGREIHLHLPHGTGRSELAAAVDRALPGGTTRNWRTVLQLHEMVTARR